MSSEEEDDFLHSILIDLIDNTMSESSDSDALPDLVDSTDEDSDSTPPELSNAECADNWLRRKDTYREKQEHNMRLFALGPFLFALTDVVPSPWMGLLHTGGLLINKKREKELTFLSWVEWGIVDLLDEVISVVFKKMLKRNYLIAVLTAIDNVDSMEAEELTFENSFAEAAKENLIIKLWMKALRLNSSKTLEKEAKCAVLYVCKIYHTVVVGLARQGRDVVEEMKKSFRTKDASIPMKFKDIGNEQYQYGHFETAIDYYTKAAQTDPFNHIFFGNRAQSYNKLKKHREALADGRRAVALKPDWAKGYYRYAQALYELDKLSLAITVNKKGLEICHKSKTQSDSNMKDLEQQGQKFRQRREEEFTNDKLRRILQETKLGVVQVIPEINDITGEKHVIDLTAAINNTKLEFPEEDDVPPLSESSDDDDVPELIEDDDQLSFPVPGKELLAKVKNAGQKDDKKSSKHNKTKQSTTNHDEKQVYVNESETLDKKSLQCGAPNSVKTKLTEESNNAKVEKKEPEKVVKEPEKPIPPPKDPEVIEFEKSLSEGYFAGQNGNCTKALTNYKRALELTSHYGQKHFGLDNRAVVSLKYVYGSMAVDTGIYKNIMDATEKFNDIIRCHDEKKFPLAFYGLAKASIALNRYKEALDPLKTALKITNNHKLTALQWPGEVAKIDESIHQPFVKLIKHLMLSSRYPPPPDAKCRYHSDDEDNRSWIYLSDPDFKGFTRILCNDHCVIEFHNQCWKVYKCKFGDLDKVADKEMLDTSCPTPECKAFIIKIFIIRQDTTVKEIVSDKKHPRIKTKSGKCRQKTPASSFYKIERKRERKEWRKKRRQELREERNDLLEEIEEIITPIVERQPPEEERKTSVTMATAGGGNNEEEEEEELDKVRLENSSVFKREEEDNLDKYKVVKKHKIKKKKEKEKVKQVIAVDFNFSDDKQLVNEHTQEVEEEEEERKRSQKSQYGHQPFSVPSGLETSVQAFERSYAKPQPKPDEISLNLFSFFEDLLAATGPLHADDIKITSMVEDFPQDAKDRINKAGGLCKFLQQSVQVKFAMIDDVVCLLRDAAKARDISQKQANPVLPDTKRKNAWELPKTENSKVFTPAVIDKPSLPINGRSFNNVEEKKSSSVPVTSEMVISKSGGIDSLDDFSLSSPVKYSRTPLKFESTVGGMDTIDDISYPKTKRSSQICDGPDGMSDTESNKDGSIVSDWDSVSCRSEEILKPIGDDEKVIKSLSSPKLYEIHQNESLNASRSSSRSDISSEKSDVSSEHLSKLYNTNGLTKSCDAQSMESIMKGAYTSQTSIEVKETTSTAEFMSRAYKSQGVADPWSSSLQPSPRSVPPVPASWTTTRPYQGEIKPPSKGFGPIGSPVSSSNNDSNTLYKPKPQVTNKSNSLSEEVAVAAKLQEKKVDQELVSELAEEVMKQMFERQPNVSENVKQETFKRVTRDIWDDFNKCGVNPSVNSSHSFSYSNSSGNIWAKGVTSSNWDTSESSKHSFAEQFMKNHYQTTKTIPEKPDKIEKTNGLLQSRSTLLPATSGQGFSTATSSTIGNNIWSSNHNDIKTSSFYSSVPPPLAMPSHCKPVGGHSIWSSPAANFSPTVSQPPLFIKPIAPPPINSLFQNGGQKNVMSTAVQVVMETKCVETNTDPYDDYKDRYLGVQEEKDNLESNFRSAAQQIQELTRMLQERERMCKMFEAELEKKRKQLESLSVISEEKEKSLTKEITKKQKELHQNQQLQTELLERCNGTEKKLSEVQASVSHDRERMRQLMSEKELAVNNAHEFCISMEAEVERAKLAEIEVMKEQHKNAMAMLTRSQKEAQFHIHKLTVLMKKCQEEKQALPVHLQQTMDHYQTIKKKCEAVIKRLDYEFEDHIQQIRNGKKLSDLPQIHVPPPPPPPPMPQLAIQAPMANSMVPRALPSSVGTSRGSKPASPPAPLSMPSLYDRGVEDTDKTATKMLEHPVPPKPLVPPGAQPKPLAPPLGVQPRPLAPPSGTVGHLPPRPLIGVRPPLAGTAVRPSIRSSLPSHAPKNSFEKLIERLQIVFPKYNRAVFTRLIQQLRQDRGGSLSGTTLDQIVQHVSELITSLEKTEQNTSGYKQSTKLSSDPPKPIAPPPGLGGSWGFAATTSDTPSQGEVFEEVEDPCVICYEEMTPATTANLDCGHMFHDACIRKWFREQSTCPNCRKHALMPDEYPTLK